jgi:SAM-dependent methyltransferase
MLTRLRSGLGLLKNTIFHPQWLTLRYQYKSKSQLRNIKNRLVLDVGSGNSDYSSYIHPSNKIIRLDYPQTNIRYKLSPDIYGNAEFLPFKKNSFDSVLLLEVLEHIPNDRQALEQINSVLVSEGMLYLSVPFLYPMHDRPFDYRRYTVHGLLHLLESAKFEVVTVISHGNSLLVAFQLLNLASLEFCRWLENKSKFVAIISCVFAYLFCLSINVISLAGLPLNFLNSAHLGYFIIAKKSPINASSPS